MIIEHSVSIRQACKEIDLPKSTVQYDPVPKNDDEIIEQLNRLIEKHP